MHCFCLSESAHFVDFLSLLTYAQDSSRGALMSQQPLSSRILAGAITFVGLGIVWMAIASNLPSQQELSAKESLKPPAQAVPVPPLPEPVLDLSIPVCQRHRRHPRPRQLRRPTD